jgi:hypothetical protein
LNLIEIKVVFCKLENIDNHLTIASADVATSEEVFKSISTGAMKEEMCDVTQRCLARPEGQIRLLLTDHR